MALADFVHLHVHSAFSLSEGAIKVKDLIKLCRKHHMPAVAVTDTGNLFGAMEFSLAALEDPAVQPIIGCQIWMSRDGGAVGALKKPDPDQLVLLVQNSTGYANLCALTSKAFLETPSGEIPQVSHDDLAAHAEGLLCLTGGPRGAIGRLLIEGQRPAAAALFERLREIFPGRLYVELMRHGLEDEARCEGGLLDLAYEHGVPLVATNDVYFADEGMFEAHDALICIAGHTTVSEPNRRRFTAEHRFRSAEEMKLLFADLPEAIANTMVIARRCAFAVPKREPILPRLDLGGRDPVEELSTQAKAGLETRLAAGDIAGEAATPYRERLAYEVAMIGKMGFASYFLIVADFIRWAKTHGVPVGPGRGSGAGSVVAWALTITDLDPLRFGLLFERFLNPERVSMPDFDIDFCQDKRDRVIHYVVEKYGADRVAQIITFGKLQARAAVRDVGRALGMPYGQVDKLAKLVPFNPAKPVTLAQAIEQEPALREARDQDEAVARLLDTAMRIEGLYRHASTHAAGVVMVDQPLSEIVPVYRDPRSSMPVTQFEMKSAESAGLVKFDFLGLKTLTMLDRARTMLAARGVEVDFSRIPLDDRPTYEHLAKGETVGVFQLESSGMRDAVVRLKPDRFEDIIALVALYRPGPMENIPKYINCKHGKELPDYLHPRLEPVLRETFGIAVYQEQVMEIAKVLSGYSLGGADLLRRAMGKKIKSEMDAQRATFVKGAVERGVGADSAEHIFEVVEKFAGYGFNKSHAAAYALVSYQTAWLKANHPVEFLAASMSLDRGDTDKLALFRQEAKRLGIEVLPPDINASGADFT
ncbi:MAG: DNA polymerase III subunit alpha, partial [Alphaproteobacteria bacterium]|nr:DNA polymerase III subunit alpha [Alphaproteobacteria bacterium]